MEEESNKRQHEEMDADEELPLLPGQKKRKNKSQAEAKDSEFLAELDKQLAEASQMLSEHFTERQIERYESFRRSFLKDATMRKVIQGATDKTLGKPALVAIKGEAWSRFIFFFFFFFFLKKKVFQRCCQVVRGRFGGGSEKCDGRAWRSGSHSSLACSRSVRFCFVFDSSLSLIFVSQLCEIARPRESSNRRAGCRSQRIFKSKKCIVK